MWIFLLAAMAATPVTTPAEPPGERADIYVNVAPRIETEAGSHVDILVGNGGSRENQTRFDVFLEVTRGTTTICSKATNFVTPLAAGQRVAAFRLQATHRGSGKRSLYSLRVHTHFWGETTDSNPSNNQLETVLDWPPSLSATCSVLKPIQ